MEKKSHWHCVYDLKFHLVLVTKYRNRCLSPEILIRLKIICSDLCEKWNIDLLEFGGEGDHIHLLISSHPNIQMSKFVNNLKTVSSRLTRKEFADHLKKFYWKPVLWTRAYCLLTTGGASIEIIEKYIQKQGKQH